MDANQIVYINTLVQSSCKIKTGKRLHKAVFDTGTRKSVMSYFTYLLITDHLKTPLQPNYIWSTTANKTKLIKKCPYWLLSNLEKVYTSIDCSRTLICCIFIGFNFITLYKVGLYWDGGKGYPKIGDQHIVSESIDLVNS